MENRTTKSSVELDIRQDIVVPRGTEVSIVRPIERGFQRNVLKFLSKLNEASNGAIQQKKLPELSLDIHNSSSIKNIVSNRSRSKTIISADKVHAFEHELYMLEQAQIDSNVGYDKSLSISNYFINDSDDLCVDFEFGKKDEKDYLIKSERLAISGLISRYTDGRLSGEDIDQIYRQVNPVVAIAHIDHSRVNREDYRYVKDETEGYLREVMSRERTNWSDKNTILNEIVFGGLQLAVKQRQPSINVSRIRNIPHPTLPVRDILDRLDRRRVEEG